MATAMAYRQQQVKANQHVGTLYTRDGLRLAGDGALDAKAGRGQLPQNLGFVFGQQPPNNMGQAKQLEFGKLMGRLNGWMNKWEFRQVLMCVCVYVSER